MTAYVVFAPKPRGQEKVNLVTEDLEAAKSHARKLRDSYQQKGWTFWADKVRLIAPKGDYAMRLGNELIDKGNTFDMLYEGNVKVGTGNAELLWHWGQLLQKAAKS